MTNTAANAPDFLAVLVEACRQEADRSVAIVDWWRQHVKRLGDIPGTGARAAIAGALAPSLGHAFVAGYRYALERLAPNLVALDEVVSFAVSEVGGAHPKAIESRLVAAPNGFLLSGEKSWSTLAPLASTLLVAAAVGQPQGSRKDLKMVRIPAKLAGIAVVTRAETPFMPNVPHAVVTFHDVAVAASQILPGDGYADFIKPFRTLEDIHVTAAGIGYLLRLARLWQWPGPLCESLLMTAAAADALAAMSPVSPSVHLGLAGLLNRFQALASEADLLLQTNDSELAADWRRDAVVFGVAGNARRQRRERAWEILNATS